MPAIGAITESGGNRTAALGTNLGGPELEGACLGMAGLVEDPSAAGALQEGLSPLDGDQGNEEKTYIMVEALESG